ncbi:MAG: VOC family protein [Chloroflexi bacterium]|nr:VOC family protein [Chloroflexota bacterium]
MIKRIYGVNVAVKDLDGAIETYRKVLGVEPEMLEPDFFAFPNLRGAAFRLGETVIQLITSLSEDTSVAKFLAARGEGVFLVSLETDNAAEDVETMRERGARFVLDENSTGVFGEVNFIHPKALNGVQYEVFQPAKK